MKYTIEERVFIVLLFTKSLCCGDFDEVKERFSAKFPNRSLPSKRQCQRVYEKFVETGK